MQNTIYTSAKPFVKWVGGKTQLLKDIKHALPANLAQTKDIIYVEPFVGGGAVLFWILQQFPNIKRAVINDINPHLITTYKIVKEQPGKLIERLKVFQNEYIPLGEEDRKAYYLAKRDIYNNSSLPEVEIAALFIFLNRTCFNGLYRVNSKGKFNVPHGKYATPRICDEDTILADSHILQKVEILCGDFAETAVYASPNALFYFDPPYKPLSKTSSFNSYAKEEFDDNEQIRLRDFCSKIAGYKANFILSNSDVKGKNEDEGFFDEIYNAYNIRRVMAKVLYVKQGTNKQFAILDAGMTDLIRPALYQAFHKIENITSDAPQQTYDVVGPICESSDVFGKAVDLNGVKRGDLIALRSAGAYGEIMASGYNCRELPQGYTSDELV
jgi:DNA adenine methylase